MEKKLTKGKKLTLADLTARKEQSKLDKLEYREIEVPELGGVLSFKKLPLSKVLGVLDSVENAESFKQSFDLNVELTYLHCPMLQDKELQEAYDCAEPYDVVTKLFDDNIGAISKLAEDLLEFYGLTEAKEQVKN